jgi:hydroxymethylpyrimidine pyrophosphatase-like HAD family hydrolase
MQFQAIASDYDRTLARDGQVDRDTMTALERARASGLKLILVTGRELDSLRSVFSSLRLFDRIVAENGALLYRPATAEEKDLGPAPAVDLVAHLRRLGIPLSVGRCIVSTVRPHETTVLQLIRELHLDLQVIFNYEAVMVLPVGVDKSTGLSAALSELGLPAQCVVGIGDAENDHGFLSLCGCSVAVANAIPELKQRAQVVARGSYGAGVAEVIAQLIDTGRIC